MTNLNNRNEQLRRNEQSRQHATAIHQELVARRKAEILKKLQTNHQKAKGIWTALEHVASPSSTLNTKSRVHFNRMANNLTNPPKIRVHDPVNVHLSRLVPHPFLASPLGSALQKYKPKDHNDVRQSLKRTAQKASLLQGAHNHSRSISLEDPHLRKTAHPLTNYGFQSSAGLIESTVETGDLGLINQLLAKHTAAKNSAGVHKIYVSMLQHGTPAITEEALRREPFTPAELEQTAYHYIDRMHSSGLHETARAATLRVLRGVMTHLRSELHDEPEFGRIVRELFTDGKDDEMCTDAGVIQVLLDVGLDGHWILKAKYIRSLTPEALHILLEHGAHIGAETMYVLRKHPHLKSIIQHPSVHMRDAIKTYRKYGKPLLHAVKNRNTAEMMIHKGVPVNTRNGTGRTRLHGARDLEDAEMLLRRGANVNARNKYGYTPLHLARDHKIAEMLLYHGANVNAETNSGHRPIDTPLFDRRPDPKVYNTLIEHGADISGLAPHALAWHARHGRDLRSMAYKAQRNREDLARNLKRVKR